jgi:Ca-activated chloride channel homolog
VSKDPEADAHLAQALRDGHIQVDSAGPAGVPLDIGEAVQYDAILFSNVPAMGMRTEQMELIRAACRDLGVGFAMIGGDDSFGLGGYYKTAVEDTLPVSMDITHKEHFPATSLVIGVDTSGSMGAMEGNRTKQEIANQAAGLAAELLTARDELCVFGSEDTSGEVLPLEHVTDIPEAQRKISRLQPGGGGIYVRRSLQRAYDILNNKAEGQIKHVIILADGSDCDEQDGSVDLARRMFAEHNITTTMVSLGNGPHTPFQKDVADAGGGRLYVAERMEDVPRIYTKETLLVARSLMCEEPFLPNVDASAPPLKGIDWSTAPPLLGYVGTSEKPTAQVFMRTHKDDPLFASWQFGLGRSIAFTSDAQNRWAAEWIGWPAYGKFWQQSTRWALRSISEGMFDATVQIERGEGTISVEALGGSDEFLNNLDIRARLVTPDNEGHDLRLEQIAPGRYQQEFAAQATGAYMANLTYEMPDGTKESQTAGAVVPYPEEYRQLTTDDFLLTRVAETSGGETRDVEGMQSLYEQARASVRTPTPIWPQLLILAVILMPLDVAIRRLVLDQRQWEMAREKMQEFRARVARTRRETAPKDGTLEALLTTKQETWDERPTGAPVAQAGPAVAAPPPVENEEARRLREQLAAATARKQPSAPGAPPQPAAPDDGQGDTFSRLMAAKKRVSK